ncbi:hypothetical protein SBOR_7686 [Sclerotinia borealis F-4128]|uniref:Major facilitator superfamily (MFS) profile domain-containing protein n=1 Tax=Sclerotinia borealis (strain F-4128) TaxID=1432307 RepID=W9C7V9_SCLBF|nr:hypothetical protein SBOR_7686 [Sclerotinia borealis F-4128]
MAEAEARAPVPQIDEKQSLEKGDSSRADEVEIPKHTSFVNVMVLVTACLGGFLYGFAANAISGTVAQPTFIAKFLTNSQALQLTDAMLGGFLGGAMIGCLLQAPISNKFGRRIANGAAALIVIIAAAISAGAVNVAMFIAGRVLTGVGAGMVLANSPVYMSEVAPPHNRGMLVGLQGVGIVTAYIMAAVCALGFNFVKADYQWRLVFVVLGGVACLLILSLWFLPESPRWLMEKGRDAEAKQVLEYLHKTTADPYNTLARAEAVQIKAQVDTERALPKGFIYIFSTPHLRKRAFISIILWTMGQGTGITAIANLIPTFMAGLGFGTVVQLGLGIVWSVCAVIGCGINVVLLDRIGRRKLLIIGGFGMAAILSTMAALVKYYLGTPAGPGVRALVALYFIMGAFFTSTIECTSYVYGSEIWPTHLRSEGSTITYLSFFGNAIAYSAPVSVGLNNIGWKFYMILIVVTVITTIMIVLWFPETMGLTLEEINVTFGDKVELQLKDALYNESESTTDPSKPESAVAA